MGSRRCLGPNLMTALTIRGKNDGFGAQYQAIMSGIAFCHAKNYLYKHTPIQCVDHDGNPEQLNAFMGVKSDSGADECGTLISEPYIDEVHWHKYPNRYYTKEVLKKIRDSYHSTPKPPKCDYDVAIHIRRGDVDSETKDRYTPNNYYRKFLAYLKRQYRDFTFCIYSEGSREDFSDLESSNLFFHLNGGIEETFHQLVTAKILVTAKSSFSYAAGILSTGTIYYTSFWHKPLNHWKRVPSLSRWPFHWGR